MKFNRIVNENNTFGNLKVGDTFVYVNDNSIMMKVEPWTGEEANAIELPSCRMYILSSTSIVRLVECEINITE